MNSASAPHYEQKKRLSQLEILAAETKMHCHAITAHREYQVQIEVTYLLYIQQPDDPFTSSTDLFPHRPSTLDDLSHKTPARNEPRFPATDSFPTASTARTHARLLVYDEGVERLQADRMHLHEDMRFRDVRGGSDVSGERDGEG